LSLLCSAPSRGLHSFPTRRSSDLADVVLARQLRQRQHPGIQLVDQPFVLRPAVARVQRGELDGDARALVDAAPVGGLADGVDGLDRKSTRLNSSHVKSSYAVFCLQ